MGRIILKKYYIPVLFFIILLMSLATLPVKHLSFCPSPVVKCVSLARLHAADGMAFYEVIMGASKICIYCKQEKIVSEFYFLAGKDGKKRYQSCCKPCLRIKCAEYKKLNKDKVNKANAEYMRGYRSENPDQKRIWYFKNKERVSDYKRARSHIEYMQYTVRLKKNESFKIGKGLQHSLNLLLKGSIKHGMVEKCLGCTILSLRLYLGCLFKDGMAWENYGSVWSVDHIIPRIKFDLTKKEEVDRCFNYTNLQPMFKNDNCFKHTKSMDQFVHDQNRFIREFKGWY